MTPQAFSHACQALPAATMDIQWGDHEVWKVGGKMFAVLGAEGSASFKASDIAFEALTESGQARPAPYMARAKWVQFDDLGPVDADEMKDWLASAHALVAGKLTKKARRELGLA